MAEDKSKEAKDIVGTPPDLERQIKQLQQRPLLRQPQQTDGSRKPNCLLRWTKPDDANEKATSLGAYSRWLIGAYIVMQDFKASQRLDEVLEVSTTPKQLRQLFGDSPHEVDSRLKLRARYENPDEDDEVGEPFFSAIIRRLNGKYAATRGTQIKREDFLHVVVPIDGENGVVGERPIESFKQWIIRGVGLPSRASILPLFSRAQAPDELTAQILEALAEGTEGPQHERVVNVFSSSLTATAVAARSCNALVKQQGRKKPETSVIYVDLALGVSRKDVVRQLYRDFGLNMRRLRDLDRRTVDLANDLGPLRKALTVNRCVVIFDGWDNVSGPLRALHEYLCDTNWAEFLRVLAQPCSITLLANADDLRPQYKFLVLTTRRATELQPWAKFIAAPAAPAASESTAGKATEEMPSEADKQRDWLLNIVALRLIAASINGMRRDTLARCLDEWIRMFHPSWVNDAARLAHGDRIELLLKEHAAELYVVDEEELESLPALQRYLELDRRPGWQTLDRESAQASVVTFRSRQLRSAFIKGWLESERQPRRIRKQLRAATWAHIALVLSEECFRQVTSQLRHLPPEEIDSPHALRRAVQAIYHGLMSLEVSAEAKPVGLYQPILSEAADKRYVYLYRFAYRHLVEGKQWRLGKSFGRSDIRLDLLAMFVSPDLGRAMLTELGDEGTSRSLPTAQEIRRGPKPLGTYAQLRRDLIETLGRAGLDVGGATGKAAAQWALGMLGRERDNSRNSRKVATLRRRLELDLRLFDGDPSAADLCSKLLRELGLPAAELTNFRKDISKHLAQMWAGQDGVTSQLRGTLDRMQKRVLQKVRTGPLENVAPALFRLGEFLFMTAEGMVRNGTSSPTPRDAIETLAHACAVYWVADRVRSDAASGSKMGSEWPLAGARPMRNYVRCCIRLVQRLAQSTSDDSAGSPQHEKVGRLILRLLEHAHNRLGVYTRHHFQFRRERNSMLMLEVSRARTSLLVGIEDHRRRLWAVSAPDHQRVQFLDQQWSIVKALQDLLQETETYLLSLGFQPALVRRFYLERIETVIAMVELGLAYRTAYKHCEERHGVRVTVHLESARSQLQLLTSISDDSQFWRETTKRLSQDLTEVERRWGDREKAPHKPSRRIH